MQAFEKALKAGPCETAKQWRPQQPRQERPILRVRSENGDEGTSTYSFSSIDAVPGYVLRDVILGVLRRYGQTTDDELIKAAARELGFQRVGNRIAARIGRRIAELLAANVVRRADGDRLCAS
jgi:hypothetical protein